MWLAEAIAYIGNTEVKHPNKRLFLQNGYIYTAYILQSSLITIINKRVKS
ncbi:hypothetical protein FORC36_1178 [Vibrio vulnificus]|nr:hypothetical protein FORC36_1178 [Vibrio vulnificus]